MTRTHPFRDVVSFHKPGSTEGTVYSHRIAEVHEDGRFSTAGDLSGPDAWVVEPTDVVGRVVHIWPGAGWLVLGGLVTGTLVLLLRRPARLPPSLVGAAVTLAAASYVSTGLLPIRVTAPGGSSTDITPGEAGSVTRHATGGTLQVDVHSHVPAWFWVLLLSVCFSPAVGSALVGRREQSGLRLDAAPAA